MPDSSSDTFTFWEKSQDIEFLLLKAIDNLSKLEDSKADAAIQDLRKVADSISELQGGVSKRIHKSRHKLEILADVGHVINSTLGLKRVLEEVIDSIIDLVQAERGFLVLRDEEDSELKVKIARGIDHVNLDEASFAFSRTIVQLVISTSQPVLTTNAQDDPRFGKEASVIMHQLRSILCVPMKLKEKTIGVVFVDNRVQTGLFRDSDLNLLSAFAEQAAMAIHNARLFDELQAANVNLEAVNSELQIAYEATLQGWVRALDLRDKETEGHTQRVTALTQKLASQLGVAKNDLIHIKRGALLHDIGKMGIQDSILLKPGKLTVEELEVIQQHPILAYEMLKPIDFLKPAIDIPYCHHEKWDGSGYPRGLRGEEIPFAARIFSVVDVWDALTSVRPYRTPMEHSEVIEYIREQSASHFDPKVVEAFLDMNQAS